MPSLHGSPLPYTVHQIWICVGGGWYLASVLDPCTYSWTSTCAVDAKHVQGSQATIYAIDLEMAVIETKSCGSRSDGSCHKLDTDPKSGAVTKCNGGP